MTPSIDQLQAENEALRAELERLRLRDRVLAAPAPLPWKSVVGTSLLDAANSIRASFEAGATPTKVQWFNLLEAAFRRFVRVSLIGLAVALLPTVFLAAQTLLLHQQNSFIKEANRFNIGARDVLPQVRVRVDRKNCTVINTGRFPIHDIRTYREDRSVNETALEVVMGGFNPSAINSTATEIHPSLAPGAQHQFTLNRDDLSQRDCTSFDAAPGCQPGHHCPMWLTCHVIFHRDGDRRPYIATQRARPAVKDGVCQFENLNPKWLALSSGDPDSARWLKLLNKMDETDRSLDAFVIGSEEVWGTDSRPLENSRK